MRANCQTRDTVSLHCRWMGSTELAGSSACLEIAYCGPFVRDNWGPIVVKYVAQIGADGSNSDTCHSPGWRGGARPGQDCEEGHPGSGTRLALVSAFNRPMCRPFTLDVALPRYVTLRTVRTVHEGRLRGADTMVLHLPHSPALGLHSPPWGLDEWTGETRGWNPLPNGFSVSWDNRLAGFPLSP